MAAARDGINVTPMIDILLVLIILFMVITPYRSMGLPALAPEASNGAGDNRAVVVSVNEDGGLAINSEKVAWTDFAETLRKIFAARAEKVLFVSGAPQTDFENVARVLDTARGAGIDRVALLPGDVRKKIR